MADIMIKNLNQRVSSGIQAPQLDSPQKSGAKFDEILQSKSQERLFEKLTEMTNDEKLGQNNQMTLSADNISIKGENEGLSVAESSQPKKSMGDVFASLNNDSLKMDSIIEVLSSNQSQLSKKQLLAYQASIATLSLNTEMFSKLSSTLSQNINTILQTNMG